MSKTILTFSGQGSQYYQMGRDLFEKNSLFRTWMERAQACFQEKTGLCLLEHLYDKSKKISDPFDLLEYSHPTLFAVQYAVAKVVLDITKADAVLGASLGEFIAMAVAGIFSFEDAFDFIIDQARFFNNQPLSGAMIALFAPKEQIDAILINERDKFHYAGHNSTSNFTICATKEDWKTIEPHLVKNKLLYQVLPANYPFHSPHLDPLEASFCYLASHCFLNTPTIPLISCVNAKEIDTITIPHLWDVVRKPILLTETLINTVNPEEDILIDISPTGSTCAAALGIFGRESPLNENCFKTLTQFQNGQKNIERIQYVKRDHQATRI